MLSAAVLVLGLLLDPHGCDVSSETVQSFSAPNSFDTRAGKFEYIDGVPTDVTAKIIYDTKAIEP